MTKCPRCGSQETRGGKITLPNGVIAYDYYCTTCSLLEQGSTLDPDGLRKMTDRWEPRTELETKVKWETGATLPVVLEAVVNGDHWQLCLNDSPRQSKYTLFVNQKERTSLNHWPNTWAHPALDTRKKRILSYVANFREHGWDDDASAPSLKDARGRRSSENKELVVRYLRAGVRIGIAVARDRDIFDPSRSETRTLMTDGKFAWPGITAYYVERYDVELPEEFERHMAEARWTIDGSIDIKQLTLPGDVDE